MHGPHRIQLSANGTVETIEPFVGLPDVAIVCPGFVDIQMNGFKDITVANASQEELLRLDDYLFAQGTTSWLGTIVTAPLEKMTSCLGSLHDIFLSRVVQGFVGIHIEGPFLGLAPGAHNTKHIIACDMDWISQLPSSVQLVTIAPEQTDAVKAIGILRDRDITVSLGHCRPTRQQFEDAVNAGASMVTHLFNAMSGVHHREEGLALWSMTDNRISSGVIGDLVHVQPDAINLAFRASGSRICLVSDSVAWMSPDHVRRNIELKDGAPRMADGTLAGSSTPLGTCVKNIVEHCGVSVESALASATSIPADAIGLPGGGRIRIGQQADVLGLETDLSVLTALRRLQL